MEVLRCSPLDAGLFESDIGGGVKRLPGAGLPSDLAFCLPFTAPGGGGIGLPEGDFGEPGGGGILFPEAETGPLCAFFLLASLSSGVFEDSGLLVCLDASKSFSSVFSVEEEPLDETTRFGGVSFSSPSSSTFSVSVSSGTVSSGFSFSFFLGEDFEVVFLEETGSAFFFFGAAFSSLGSRI